ncbi:hypothetical protein Q8A67_016247 [Cirrhinus molitorella]|uniref:GH18 domain-containing protein n=1 Tax=Cirrhinus molitorella TaxID=172907 RepID=A0AA88PCH1_9TELE|nr:hypothetical protein Q8A67_016247 [Cirrhinus molitorella]
MQLNRAFVFFCLVISVGAQESHRLNCYLDVLTHHTREGPCSHIILPLTFTDDVLYLQNLSEEDSVTLRKMKERNPALKILLGLGVRSSRLELMSANEAGVETFVQTVLTYLKDKSLDGLDVTWLDSPSDESSRSTELFTNLLKSLKGAFEKETQPLLLSVSVLEPADHSAVTYEERTLSQYVDFISILPAHLEKDGPYINKTVKHWQDRQVELQKLNLVLPAFLQRSRRRHHHRDHHKHDMKTETGKKDHVHILGLYLGNQVCQAIKSGQEQFITLTSLSNEQSVVAEVLQKGFGGIGVVFIDLDVFYNSVCAQITQDERAMVESKHTCVREGLQTESVCVTYVWVPRDVRKMQMHRSEPICTKALSSFRCKDEFSAACCVMAFQHHRKIITDQRGTCQMLDMHYVTQGVCASSGEKEPGWIISFSSMPDERTTAVADWKQEVLRLSRQQQPDCIPAQPPLHSHQNTDRTMAAVSMEVTDCCHYVLSGALLQKRLYERQWEPKVSVCAAV